ncbi:MAG: hypothetical protein ABIB98_00510 [bacterium]
MSGGKVYECPHCRGVILVGCEVINTYECPVCECRFLGTAGFLDLLKSFRNCGKILPRKVFSVSVGQSIFNEIVQ